MLLKKKLFKKKQMILRYFVKKNELFLKLKSSLLRNHFNYYKFRLSFTYYCSNIKNNKFFKSKQKLICLYSLGKKVPSKHFLFSRFTLNKYLNFLKINNTAS